MPTRLLALVLFGVLSALAGFSVAGMGPWAGPKIATLSANHGIHLGDVPVFILWAAGACCCGVLWFRDDR